MGKLSTAKFAHLLLGFLALMLSANLNAQEIGSYRVSIDIANIENDEIAVAIELPNVGNDEVTYVMPYIVPGVYARDKYGQFIRGFKAFDAAGNEVKTKRVKKNAWKFSGASKIIYRVGDSWDNLNFIFRAGGTNIEPENIMLNHTGFYGYIQGYKQLRYDLHVTKPVKFYGATAMNNEARSPNEDHFSAPGYVIMADQPIMYGKPDTASHMVGNTRVNIAVYSPNKRITAKHIDDIIQPLTVATAAFLGELPVEEYQYLFYFDDNAKFPSNMLMGALEHSNSSVYYLTERTPDAYLQESIRSIAAHEFLHILSPLNLHSEHIADFSFHAPTMSQHLWLYEGVTEYFSMLLEVQTGLITEYAFRRRMQGKINSAADFKPYSLTEMSIDVLGRKNLISKARNAKLYGDIYEKGAVVAFCLDLRIRKLTNGNKDLLAVIQELMGVYGKSRPFTDSTFIDEFVRTSHPELRAFFDDYVIGEVPLDYEKELGQLGWNFLPKGSKYGAFAVGTGFGYNSSTATYSINTEGKNTLGLRKGDVIESVNSTKDYTVEHLIELLYPSEEGPASVTVTRQGVTVLLKSSKRIFRKLKTAVILTNHEATEEDKALQSKVMRDSQ
jgi:predicted metalloprotease with PDZ domain